VKCNYIHWEKKERGLKRDELEEKSDACEVFES